MDLETYESDLADYSLQDSPFYEASRPMIFDLSMSAVNNLMASTVASGSGKGALMLKTSTTSIASNANDQAHNYSTPSSNERNEAQSMRYDLVHRSGMIGIPIGNKGNRVAPEPLELTANTSGSMGTPMSTNGPEPTKKKRKCVSFLPNYVQVNMQSPFVFSSMGCSNSSAARVRLPGIFHPPRQQPPFPIAYKFIQSGFRFQNE